MRLQNSNVAHVSEALRVAPIRCGAINVSRDGLPPATSCPDGPEPLTKRQADAPPVSGVPVRLADRDLTSAADSRARYETQ